MSRNSNNYESLEPYYEASRSENLPHMEVDLGSLVRGGVSFTAAITADPDVAVIAEHKRYSPSEGAIRPESPVRWMAQQYAEGGAKALSVLAQERYFKGRKSDIRDAFDASGLPVLYKDFIGDEYQLHQAKTLGAAAALLIVAGLTDMQLRQLMQEAQRIDLECLVEVHDAAELTRALGVDPPMVGVNNRNLSTLKRDLKTAQALVPQIPDGITIVAESGYSVRNPEHIHQLRELGVDAVMMGTALMREPDPAIALADWLATGQAPQ